MAVRWIKTDKHVFGAIYREHCDSFSVFSGCTVMDKDYELGTMHPYMLTEWGFKSADEPLIRSVARKRDADQKEWDYEHFIAHVYHEEE